MINEQQMYTDFLIQQKMYLLSTGTIPKKSQKATKDNFCGFLCSYPAALKCFLPHYFGDIAYLQQMASKQTLGFYEAGN